MFTAELISVSHGEDLYDKVMESELKCKSKVSSKCCTAKGSSHWIIMELPVFLNILF